MAASKKPAAAAKKPAAKSSGKGGHDLVFREGRRTPEVVPKGAPAKKESGGKVASRRSANASEEKTISRGDWVRVNSAGKKPTDSGYKDKAPAKGRKHLDKKGK